MMKRYVLLGLLLLGLCSSSHAGVGLSDMINWTHPLNRHLLAWWRGIPGVTGADTFLDLVHGNDFLLLNMGYSSTSGWSPSTGTGGYWRVNFDGVDDNGTCGNPPALANTPERTICLWMTLTSFGALSRGRILDKQNAGGWTWMVNNVDVPNGFVFTHDFSTTPGDFGWSNVISLNTRTHVCLAYDRTVITNVPVLYINGVSAGAATVLTTPVGTVTSDAGSSLRIGDRPANDREFQGSMEDIRWFQEMLGPKDIQRIYTNSLEGSPGLLWTPEMRAVVYQTFRLVPSLLPFLRPLRPH